METGWKAGLEDVIAARSGICQVDGERGKLYYRGYEIAEVAGVLSFEDVTALLWHGELPSAAESAAFAARLVAARGLPPAVGELLQTLPRDAHPLDALRTAVSLAATRDPDVRSNEPEANLRKAFRLMTLVPETVAAWQRIRTGRAPVAAPGAASHAAYFLELLEGRAPTPEVARCLDLRDARRRRDAHRSARGDRGRDRDPEGPPARRRQRGRTGDAAGDRRAGARRALRRVAARRARRTVQARARRPACARARVRPSRLQGGRCTGARAPRHGQVDGGGHRPAEALRGGGAGLRRDAGPYVAAGERRLLLRSGLRRAGHPAGLLHVDLRGRPRRGLVRARARAVRRQPPDTAARRLHRRRAATTRSAEDGDLHGIVAEVVGAAVVAAARPNVLEVGGDLAAGDPGVVGDDGRAGHELGLELPQIVEVVRLLGVDEREVEAAGQERDGAQGVAGDDFDPPRETGLGGVRAHEIRQERIRLDARQPSSRRHRASDQDRRVAEQRAELDAARGTMPVEEPPDHAALRPPDRRDVPVRRGAVHQRQHPAGLLRHARAAGTRPATVSGTG